MVQWSAIVIITATGTRHASMSHVATRTGGKWTRQQNKKEKWKESRDSARWGERTNLHFDWTLLLDARTTSHSKRMGSCDGLAIQIKPVNPAPIFIICLHIKWKKKKKKHGVFSRSPSLTWIGPRWRPYDLVKSAFPQNTGNEILNDIGGKRKTISFILQMEKIIKIKFKKNKKKTKNHNN